MKSVGIISDTHGLLRPEAIECLAGSDLIIHAGDIGKLQIIDSLNEVAPVKAIRGNIDNKVEWHSYPETDLFEYAGYTFYLIHDLNDLQHDIGAAGVNIVVSGHSHKAAVKQREGVLYVNPGSAGPRRFTLPVTLAVMKLNKRAPDVSICPLL